MNPLESAIADPWRTMNALVDGPLHPGGVEATGRLLDRAGAGDGTRLLDAGCGAGESLVAARERGAKESSRSPAGEMTAPPAPTPRTAPSSARRVTSRLMHRQCTATAL